MVGFAGHCAQDRPRAGHDERTRDVAILVEHRAGPNMGYGHVMVGPGSNPKCAQVMVSAEVGLDLRSERSHGFKSWMHRQSDRP